MVPKRTEEGAGLGWAGLRWSGHGGIGPEGKGVEGCRFWGGVAGKTGNSVSRVHLPSSHF